MLSLNGNGVRSGLTKYRARRLTNLANVDSKPDVFETSARGRLHVGVINSRDLQHNRRCHHLRAVATSNRTPVLAFYILSALYPKSVDMSREYDKLVRDNFPTIIEANGESPSIRTAEEEEYSNRLIQKLEEEVAEYRDSREIEELADILEVVHAIRKVNGVSADELQEIRFQKAKQKGRFDDGIVLERVEE